MSNTTVAPQLTGSASSKPVVALCRVNGMKSGTMFIPGSADDDRQLRERKAIRDLTETEMVTWRKQQEQLEASGEIR